MVAALMKSRAGMISDKLNLIVKDESLRHYNISVPKFSRDVFQESKPLKNGDDVSSICFALEQRLKDIMTAYENICDLDIRYHMAVYENPQLYDEELSREIKSLFQRCLEIARQNNFDDRDLKYPAYEFDSNLLGRWRSVLSECEAIVNPCVANIECADLADQALEQHRAGQTEEM